jgi:hypothetical protein
LRHSVSKGHKANDGRIERAIVMQGGQYAQRDAHNRDENGCREPQLHGDGQPGADDIPDGPSLLAEGPPPVSDQQTAHIVLELLREGLIETIFLSQRL